MVRRWIFSIKWSRSGPGAQTWRPGRDDFAGQIGDAETELIIQPLRFTFQRRTMRGLSVGWLPSRRYGDPEDGDILLTDWGEVRGSTEFAPPELGAGLAGFGDEFAVAGEDAAQGVGGVRP